MPRLILLTLLALSPALAANERLPAWLLLLPETTPTVFIAETSSSTYHRFDRSGDTVTHESSDYMSIGLGGDGKQRAGDQRTPPGTYFVTEQLDMATWLGLESPRTVAGVAFTCAGCTGDAPQTALSESLRRTPASAVLRAPAVRR